MRKNLYYTDRKLYMFLLSEYHYTCNIYRYWFHDLDKYNLQQIYSMYCRMIDLENTLFPYSGNRLPLA